ncbi:MAG TPA: LPS assembly lipoprotein LptE [Burkholderiales bacterium]|nr:LPS assembly lipoprotein LptE [Burkholderiales bacterium]
MMPTTVRARLLAFTLTATLSSGCGFKPLAPPDVPFHNLYVVAPDYSSFGAQFKRYVESYGKRRLAPTPEAAQAVLDVINETREKQILSLTTAGRVSEFLLRYQVTFTVRDKAGRELIPASTIALERDLTYSDEAALGKENEEAFLYDDMRNEAIRQVLGRLSAAQIPA